MSDPAHIDIIHKIPEYKRGTKKGDKRKIKEIMSQYEFDDDEIENINDDFLKGWDASRYIIIEMLKDKYWEMKEKGGGLVMTTLEKILNEIKVSSVYAETKDGYGASCVPIGAVERIIHKHMDNDGWIPVEERLPDIEYDTVSRKSVCQYKKRKK